MEGARRSRRRAYRRVMPVAAMVSCLAFSLLHAEDAAPTPRGIVNSTTDSRRRSIGDSATDCLANIHILDDIPLQSEAATRHSVLADSTVADVFAEHESVIQPTTMLQPQPMLVPETRVQPDVTLPAASSFQSADLFGTRNRSPLLLSRRRRYSVPTTSTDIVWGAEAKTRVTTDGGSLLGKSSTLLGIGLQRRTPIVTDPRIRGSRVGLLAASGSYWVPARIDLDTMLSKIDSRLIDDVLVIKGPFSVRYGPGFSHIDVGLVQSPRFADGYESHGRTSADFGTNGEQWYGRQDVWGGSDTWGVRVGYGHGTGNDYQTGDGIGIPSSYNSRDLDVALGIDPTDDSHLEFNYLRLDQTGVEFPGQAFDMDYLVTDGYEVSYIIENQEAFDQLTIDAWYNETRFEGNAQNSGKRRQFPFFDFIHYTGFTDVDSMSTGFRLATTWGDAGETQWTTGVDLRYIKQQLNEISSGLIGFVPFKDANSPLPKSGSANPGLFIENTVPLSDRLQLTAGARTDFVSADILADNADLMQLGLTTPPLPLSEILGTNDFRRLYAMWAGYLTAAYEVDENWTATLGLGHAERQPSLTELYVADSFLFLLQNGQNTATGDPRLDPEQLWQIDAGLTYDTEQFRAGLTGFHAWIHNAITFENTRIVTAPPFGQVEQVNLQYVNTDLATMAGFELYGEWDAADTVTAFATMTYVEGRDHTRNGHAATRRATPAAPSTKVAGLPRGFFSGVAGGNEEPLPMIPPLETRLGLRLHAPSRSPGWSIELATRIVDHQERVASSLLETPTPGFTIWDLRGYWHATDTLLLIAGVENFTDKNYREHFDFRSQNGISMSQPGINFYFGTELTY